MRIMLLVAGFFVLAGCSDIKGKKESKEIAEVPVIKLVPIDTVLYKDYVADIQAVKNVEIRARISGYMEKIFVDEGQTVAKGQPLFQLNNREYVIAVDKAKSGFDRAQSGIRIAQVELERVKTLVDKKVISATELELAKAKLMDAKAQAGEAKAIQSSTMENLSYAHITAPFSGIIDRIPFKIGSLVDKGSLLTTLSDDHEVFAYFNVSENEYLQIRKANSGSSLKRNGMSRLILSDGSIYPYSGRIESLGGEFDDNTGSISVRVRFPNPDKLLRHGASGKVHLATNLDNAVLVPQKAVFEIQDKKFVYVVNDSNQVNVKSFIPAGQIAQCYIVKSGLQPGERVACGGIQSLKNGSLIKPLNSTAAVSKKTVSKK